MSQSARRLSHVPTQMPSQRASLAPQPSPGPDPPPDALPDSTPTRLAAPASSASSSRAAPASVLAACGLGYATSALVPDACHVWHQDNDAVRTVGRALYGLSAIDSVSELWPHNNAWLALVSGLPRIVHRPARSADGQLLCT